MAVPTFLGVVATGSLYEAWDGGSIADSLDLTTLIDVPAATDDADVILVALFRWGPIGKLDDEYGFDFGASFSDDSAEAGDANVYSQVPNGSGFTYEFGITTVTSPDADIGISQGASIGGSVSNAYECTVTRAIPSGSTISCALGLPSGDISYFSVTVLAFQYVETPQVALSARTIDPTNTSAGDGSDVPLGDREFADVAFGSPGLLCAVVWADDTDEDGATVLGTETVTDLSGDWTQVDSGGVAALDDFGGLVFGVFVADLQEIDASDDMVQFEITGGIGTTSPNVPSGVTIFMFFFNGPAPASPTFNHVVPI